MGLPSQCRKAVDRSQINILFALKNSELGRGRKAFSLREDIISKHLKIPVVQDFKALPASLVPGRLWSPLLISML
jgi:hypothetical protein